MWEARVDIDARTIRVESVSEVYVSILSAMIFRGERRLRTAPKEQVINSARSLSQ